MKLFGYELIIRKIPKRSGYSRRTWTESETNALLRFRAEGKSWAEIAKLLNRTTSSCTARYSKIHKARK